MRQHIKELSAVTKIRALDSIVYSILLFCLSTFFSVASAQRTGHMGVVVISHGAPIPMWNETIIKFVSSVKSPYPLEVAFLDFDEERTLAKSVKRLEEKGVNEVLVIHLSPSSYSSHHEEIHYLVGLRKDLGIYTETAGKPLQTNAQFVVSPCMDDHPLIIEILKEYTKELSQDPTKESLIIVGHGPVEEVENIMWVRQLKRIGREITKMMRFREVVCMTLRTDSADLIREQAEADLKETALRLSAQGKVIVVIYALGGGMLQNEVKYILNGVPSFAISQKGIISHPNAVKWIENTIKKGMNQQIVPPINRKWTIMDRETGKPIGTHRYGLL
jgi:sirohydrochlorin ferrochelatase